MREIAEPLPILHQTRRQDSWRVESWDSSSWAFREMREHSSGTKWCEKAVKRRARKRTTGHLQASFEVVRSHG